MGQKRTTWGSNIGFLMAAIGSAVGLGNLWAFPYKMGSNGGFVFLIVYAVLVILVGIAAVLGELVIGRKTGYGAVGAYKALCKKHAWVGALGVICAFLIVGFYSVLGGMVLRYTLGYLVGIFGADGFAGTGTKFFTHFLYQPGAMVLFLAIFMAITCVIVMGGIKGGIEKFAKIAMPALVVILIIVIVYVLFQDNAKAGYVFMFKPDWQYLGNNFFSVLRTAVGQVFFSLSLGMGIMLTYGSYISKGENLQKNTVIIAIADSIVALLSGCAILPAVAAFAGENYGKGPGLLFSTMLQVFDNMGGTIGCIMGFLFFLLVLLAAITSTISLLEVCSTFAIDRRVKKGKEPKRKLVTCIFAAAAFVVGIPSALDALGLGGGAIKAPYEILGLTPDSPGYALWNDCWIDFYDMITEGILMPVAALSMCILIGWVYKTSMVKEECEISGHKFKAFGFFNIMYKFVAPIITIAAIITLLMDFFG